MQAPNHNDRVADRVEEAKVPDLLSAEERQRAMFANTNSYRSPEDLTKIFNINEEYEPFTIDDELTFTEAFKRNPKGFGAIAEFLPGRTREDCLKHYYDNKADGRFQTESLRQREARRSPKQNMIKNTMYDYGDEGISDASQHAARKEDKNVIPINEEIKRLRALLRDNVPAAT